MKTIQEFELGAVYKVYSKQFDATNYLRITRMWKDKFYGLFVDPEDFGEKRLPSDNEHCYWDFSLEDYTFEKVK